MSIYHFYRHHLQILNYERLQLDGQEYLDKYSDSLPTSGDREYLISSMVRFKRNIFEKSYEATFIERILQQFIMIFTSFGSEGGVFIFVGKKIN